jgi:CSLREA domain-containing protein
MVATLAPAPARASEYRVTADFDTPPDGCTAAECTLREAVLAANADPGGDVVVLQPKRVHTLTLPGAGEDAGATGDLDVTDPLELVATGRGRATIDATQIDRVLDLYAPVKLEGLRVTGGEAEALEAGAGAGVRVIAGRFSLRDTAIIGNRGESALELVGEEGMTARDSSISNNAGSGIVDRGGGGLRVAHTEVIANAGNGIQGFGAGSLAVYHGEVSANGLRGIQELDDGDVAAVDAVISANGKQAIDEQGLGSLYVRRSRLRDNGADALTEDADGELSVYRTKLTGSRGGAAVELGPGSIAFIKARIAFNDGLGLSEAEKGSIVLEETTLVDSPLGGGVERGEGDILLTLAEVIESGGVGLAELDDGEVSLVRARISGADREALVATDDVSLLRSRIVGNGGGIAVDGGSLSLGRSTVTDNAGAIGGISAVDARVSLRQSSVGRNVSEADGGGIALTGESALEAINATVAENSSALAGGGVFVGSGSEASLNAVTIASNDAAGAGGGVAVAAGGSATLDNSLVARNRSPAGSPDCSGGVGSGGGNLIGVATACGPLGGPGDIVRPVSRIGSLGPNGGPTPTVALRRGSPAIGAAQADAPARDQRNLSRHDPDAGAFERR